MRLTLLQRPGKLSRKEFTHALDAEIASVKGTLSASTNLKGFSKRDWAIVDVEGDDSEIIAELIARRLFLAHQNHSEIEKFGNYRGLITGITTSYLEIDIGLEAPRAETVKVNLATLRAQLCDGKPLAMKELAEEYCLFPDSNVDIRIIDLAPYIEGWLADSQIDLLSRWISLRLDRVQVLESSEREVNSAIRRANLGRDIISVDHMSLTSHSVLCKLGTDAVGLIPKLGSFLRDRGLKPFIPRRIVSRCRPW